MDWVETIFLGLTTIVYIGVIVMQARRIKELERINAEYMLKELKEL